MALFLFEIEPASATREGVQAVLDALVGGAGADASREVIESQVAADHSRLFTIVEAESAETAGEISAAVGDAATSVEGPDEVRLVGAELEDIKALRRGAGYLVEWDIPAEITMEKYLARKKANAPKYAEVPETSFLRTYVREDTAKCLCFYDAPDEDAVRRARDAVETPVDRIWALGAIDLGASSS
ncbi:MULTISPECIES: DUF4242 domain-containing protein [Brachybacterium]|uniref:DUF4242 domain-containing protein n=1 Tax=Brachybacterium alimentarium TaxID=47845 RepID=A0A2A3YI02_9MICO|nr:MULTISPECIES: DUF4242 domain-containing protein [Brachybacterium]PCC33615.1 hypothetical protein CIK71_07920 [Brachybacterium alimentarium]PCC39382.1 hypothetical protein CIK66_08960 [Brachybacterium alimentarium]RCS66337.1 DUF4242 domain-containing protein [Brachybacterium sp. JB7]RCS74549.1 DUF4242 domain-containing protein [Brachybacterium alimentarium]RCS75303.1 DUF4242 domain-containing protein [Brachybacterium alimentarium]